MQLDQALEQAKELEEIKKSQEKGGFFCSALTTLAEDEEIEEWQLGFYLPQRELITTVNATEDSCEITNTDEPLKKDLNEINMEEVDVSAKQALNTAISKLEEDYGGYYSKIILSLKHKQDQMLWAVAFVRQNMTIISLEINSQTGRIISAEEKNMFEKR